MTSTLPGGWVDVKMSYLIRQLNPGLTNPDGNHKIVH